MSFKTSQILRLKNTTERMWVQENKHLNVFNYWFYRYFTNSYRNYLIYNFDFKTKHYELDKNYY